MPMQNQKNLQSKNESRRNFITHLFLRFPKFLSEKTIRN